MNDILRYTDFPDEPAEFHSRAEELIASLLEACQFALPFIERMEQSETVIPGRAADDFMQGLSRMREAISKAQDK